MLEITIDNRNGTLWDISSICSDLKWTTSRLGKPSVVEMTLIVNGIFQTKDFKYNPGDVVRVKVDGKGLFYGYLFEMDGGRDGAVKLKAYDQLRYLNESDSYIKTKVTPEQVIKDNCAAVSLKVGSLAATGHTIPKMFEDDQKRLDIIYKALDDALIATGNIFVFYDDFGSLTLKNVKDMTIDLILGDGSLVYDYRVRRSIDTDTFNRIKLVQDNKESGVRDVYIAQDSATIAKWGRLQYFKKVDDKLNSAQIKAMLDKLITLKNRETKQFTIDAIGFVGMRAGMKVQITLANMGINQYFLVEECSHQFSGGDHTMKLELKVYG